MPNFILQKTGYIYLYHWVDSITPIKISTKIKINLTEWDKENQQPKDSELKDQFGTRIMDTLNRYRSCMNDAMTITKLCGGDLKETFLLKLNGNRIKKVKQIAEKPEGFLEYFEKRVDEFEANEKSNHTSYRTSLNNLQKYFKNKKPSFSELGTKFFDDYTTYMQKTLNYSKNTIHCQWKNIKVIFGQAYKAKIHSNLDYKDFSAGQEVTSNVFLSVDELDTLYKLDLSALPHLDRCRDMFLVGAWSGLRYSDWHRVASDIIVDDVLMIRANKTDEMCQIPVHKNIQGILSKYDGVLPPMISNQKMNDNLKIICEMAKFTGVTEKIITKGGKKSKTPPKLPKFKMVTTHTARRSFCTNAILQGASPYAVMQISGHKTLDSFDKYIKMNQILAVDNLKKLPMFQN